MVRIAAIAFAMLFCVGCSQSKRRTALTPEMMAKADAFIAEMAKIAAAFPDESVEASGTFDPVPIFGEETANTIVSSIEQLGNLETSLGFGSEDELRFYYGSSFAEWFGGRYLAEAAPRDYETQLHSAMNRRYVLALNVLAFDPPVILDDTTFSGGSATVRFALFDRHQGTWRFVFDVDAVAPASISFEGREHLVHDNVIFHTQMPVRAAVMEGARDRLEEATGGIFAF